MWASLSPPVTCPKAPRFTSWETNQGNRKREDSWGKLGTITSGKSPPLPQHTITFQTGPLLGTENLLGVKWLGWSGCREAGKTAVQNWVSQNKHIGLLGGDTWGGQGACLCYLLQMPIIHCSVLHIHSATSTVPFPSLCSWKHSTFLNLVQKAAHASPTPRFLAHKMGRLGLLPAQWVKSLVTEA